MDHLFQCPHAEARTSWVEGIDDLERFSRKKDTAPMITSNLKTALLAWMRGEEIPNGGKGQKYGTQLILKRKSVEGYF